jgi:putative tricarboxylic transport membrane protein
MVKKNIIKRINSTSLFAIILIIVNTIYLIEGFNTAPPMTNGKPGITFVPIIISTLFYIAAIYILITSIRKESVSSFHLSEVSRPIAVIFITFIYILIFKPMGYILSSIIYVFSFMFLLEEKTEFKKKKLLNIFFSSLIVVLLIYLLYQIIFKVRLPAGGVF